jgi:hypothetical protein
MCGVDDAGGEEASRGEESCGSRNCAKGTSRLARFPTIDGVAVEPGEHREKASWDKQRPERLARSSHARGGRQNAAGGEKQANEKFLGDEGKPGREGRPVFRDGGVDAREVEEGRSGEKRVAFARNERHEAKNQTRAKTCGCNGQGKKDAPVTPVEEVALAKIVDAANIECAARVEETIRNVDSPYAEGLNRRDPRRQTDSSAPGKSQRPDDGDRGSIETGKMPEVKRS